MDDVKYPEIVVRLVGGDGNALQVLAKTMAALKGGGVSRSEIAEFTAEATWGDYDHLLATVQKWVTVH